jgi:hypothetical protein
MIANLDYARGQGINCSLIQPGDSCFQLNTISSHVVYAINLYYQASTKNTRKCDFFTNHNPHIPRSKCRVWILTGPRRAHPSENPIDLQQYEGLHAIEGPTSYKPITFTKGMPSSKRFPPPLAQLTKHPHHVGPPNRSREGSSESSNKLLAGVPQIFRGCRPI